MPEQYADASEVDEAEEVLGVPLVAGDELPAVLKPRKDPRGLDARLMGERGIELIAPHRSNRKRAKTQDGRPRDGFGLEVSAFDSKKRR